MNLFTDPSFVTAEFSPCRTWRYVLRRRWDVGKPAIGFILLNPSTADEMLDDPTIRRCIGYAKRWGHGGLVLGNVFALRSTDPAALRTHPNPIGPDNDKAILRIVAEADGNVVCGWGMHGAFMNRGERVMELIRYYGQATPKALSMTSTGQPGHPLYLKSDIIPMDI